MTMFITPGDVLMAVAFVVGILIAVWQSWRVSREQKRCKHDGGVNETQACNAICRQCGKNLGFIGTWREKK